MASTIAIVVTITQVLMKLLEGPLANVAGKFKLVIVSALSVVLAVATAMAAGTDLVTALFTGAGLAAVQVFLHQVYVQFFTKAA